MPRYSVKKFCMGCKKEIKDDEYLMDEEGQDWHKNCYKEANLPTINDLRTFEHI